MKSVLIITYYWPPAGGPGVQRVLRFSRLLPEFGWRPVILTVENGDYPAIDTSLLEKVPEESTVYRCRAFEPYDVYRRFTGRKSGEKLPTFVLNPSAKRGLPERIAAWVRANIFVPDARIGWIPSATRLGKKILKEEGIDLIFSSSPPHTVQLIARRLANHSRTKWVADFRDPWTEAFWSAEIKKTRFATALDKRFEKSILNRADAVTTVSPGIQQMLENKQANHYAVIQNGFEPLPLRKIAAEKYTVLFAGHLSKYQNPESLFKAAAQLESSIREQTEIVFVGNIFDGHLPLIDQWQQRLSIRILPYMPHAQLMQFAQQAGVLFRPIADSSYSQNNVGAKTYDYLSLRKPILTLGKSNSISEKILSDTRSGSLYGYEDIEGIRAFLLARFAIWAKERYILLPNEGYLEPYTSRHNAGKLATLFDKISGTR